MNENPPFSFYPNPALSTDVIVAKNNEILLIERVDGLGYCLPGGYFNPYSCVVNLDLKSGPEKLEIEQDLSLPYCAARELEEETSLIVHPDKLNLFGIYDSPDRVKGQRVITTVYHVSMSECFGDAEPGSEAKRLIKIDILEALDLILAFDHKEIIEDYYASLSKHS